MEFNWFPYHIISVFLILISIFLFVYIYNRRYSLGAKYLLSMIGLIVVWIIGQALEISASGIRGKLIFSNIHYISVTYLPVMYLYLVLSFTRRYKVFRSKLISGILIIEPLILNVLLWIDIDKNILRTNLYLYKTPIVEIVGKQFTMVIVPFIIYNFVLTGIIIALLLYSCFDETFYYRKQAKYLLLSILIPTITTLLYFFNINFYGVDFTPISFILSYVLIIYGIIRHGMYGLSEIALDNVFNEMKPSVIVYDRALNIVNVNKACLNLFGFEKNRVVGEKIVDVFSSHMKLIETIKQNKIIKDEIDLKVEKSLRTFELTITPILTIDKKQLGSMAELYDITDRKIAELHLKEDNKNVLEMFELKEKELFANEAAFLQAQIKPHFLYNSLNVIAAICRIEPERARQLLLDLSEYMHYSYDFKKLDEFVPFEEELELINAYIRIEQARFHDKINVNFEIDNTNDLRLPPLILQPLVENAIRHGLRKKDEACCICFKLNNMSDRYIIKIQDDGIGMTDEKLDEVMNEEKTKGIGLKNVQERLKRFYGIGMEIESEYGVGTKITIVIPKGKVSDVKCSNS